MKNILGETCSVPERAYVGSEGFAKCSPRRLLGTRPPINALRPRFPVSAEINSRLLFLFKG